ncbi:MAG: carotenoid 1,2-hydratase [Candidatus Eisenbacteria bacterium]|nr:carotenoid 1,2-hydratase [Candidatus Eisenbacteria bacterium]
MSGRARPAMLVLALALAAGASLGAGPAGPPVDADGFFLADSPYVFHFPADHAAHPRYRIEWWYYTGHLKAPGRSFGYELTFFRVALPPARAASASAWAARDLMFVHAALTDETREEFRFEEAARRDALGMAGADSTRYDVWLNKASARLDADSLTHRLHWAGSDFAFDLALVPRKPPVVHGSHGVSRKGAGPGETSHYYSLTRLATTGRLLVGRDTLAVEGESWMDHEFSSSRLGGTQAGWDWFSVQLDDGRELMLYQMRLENGGIEPLSHGTLVGADGRSRPLALADFRVRALGSWRSRRTGATYPSGWTLELPRERLKLTLEPTLEDQELVATTMGGVAYWEGSVRIVGEDAHGRVTGEGYVELTGYAGRPPY